MAVYRFKVYFEDDEDVQRYLEITSSSKFLDLHHLILKSLEFDDKHEASFFVADHNWRRNEEISLNKKNDAVRMADTKLNAFMNDPHQKIIYVYDYEKEWTLYIELTGISIKEDPKVSYPRIARSVGKAPKQYGHVVKPSNEPDDNEFAYITEKAAGVEPGEDEEEGGSGIFDSEGEEEDGASEFADEGRDDY